MGGPDPTVHHAAAQSARSKPWAAKTWSRTIPDAVELARSRGIVIEEDVRFVVCDSILHDDEDALWGGWKDTQSYEWDDLLIEDKIVVKLRSSVLASDEGILCVFAHEMHEINAIRSLFEESVTGQLSGARLIYLTARGFKNLHDEAWDVGDAHVFRWRQEPVTIASGGA